MRRTRKTTKRTPAEAIARLADNGKDVSRFFTNSGRIMEPIQRVNVDFTAAMLKELDEAAKELNISRQAVVKTLVRQGLDRHYFAKFRGRKLAQEYPNDTPRDPCPGTLVFRVGPLDRLRALLRALRVFVVSVLILSFVP